MAGSKKPSAAGPAKSGAGPNYEVRLSVDPYKVLGVEFKPIRDVNRVLGLKRSNKKIAMQFIDARPLLIHPEGWNIRVRKFEDQEALELSYKRRYPLGSGTLGAALAAAARDGFDGTESDYEAQVEWGLGKQTLSFTRKKILEKAGRRGMKLPPAAKSRSAVVGALPGKLDRLKEAGWARTVLAAGLLYGPVLGKRWTGVWTGPDLSFEVWLVKTESGGGFEPVVELSFKEEREAKAAEGRDGLLELLRRHGWLLDRDVLKTEMILKRY